MSETGGIVVIQAPAQVFQSFERDHDDGLEELVAFAKADPAINDDCDVFFLSLEVKGDSACFEFENEYWLDTARRLTSTGKNIGLYLRSLDEYGGRFFLAQNPEGDSFSFFAGGPDDDLEVEGGDVVTEEGLERWLAVIPGSIKQAFPELSDVSFA
ncbi:MAG: hypothetical protein VYA08_10295 [Pseudomonadota bacterium]|nr:hypothetical protein [Pseudomonadota bacterium]